MADLDLAGLQLTGEDYHSATMTDLALEELKLTWEGYDSVKLATQVYETFEAMGLNKHILENIKEYGYEKPTAVQQRTIVPLYKGINVFGEVAESEPGKTSAICLGILQKLDYTAQGGQALVVTATSAMSQEIGKDLRKLGATLGVEVYVCGEAPSACPTRAHVVVGSPCNVMYWLRENGECSWTRNIRVVFLDELDHMVMSLIYDIFRNHLPRPGKFQVGVFSETAPQKVLKFVEDWMRNPVKITVPCTLQVEGKGKHQVLSVNAESKPNELVKLYNSIKKPSVVFVNEPQTVILLVEKMKGLKREVLSTDKEMNQKDRDKKKQELLQAESLPRVLITTEEWAKGIDLKQVTLVVNYDLPFKGRPDKYYDRMRRFGTGADAINFVTGDDWYFLFDIQEHYKNEVVFETSPLQPSQVGPAGFSSGLTGGLAVCLDTNQGDPFNASAWRSLNKRVPKASKDVKHLLFEVEGDQLKLEVIGEDLYEYLEKIKCVIFVNTPREVDPCEVLRSKFKVFTMEHLHKFLQCEEDHCILIATDVDAIHDPPLKVPLVINCDLPLELGFYDHRIAWCGRNGVAIHFVNENDWFKVFHFQSPPESVVGWLPRHDEFVRQVAKSSQVSRRSFGPPKFWSK